MPSGYRHVARAAGGYQEIPLDFFACPLMRVLVAQEIAYAHRAIAALKEAERNGQGAVTIDGKMTDYANIRMIHCMPSFANAG